MVKTLIIIPAYNAAAELEQVLPRLRKHQSHCLIVNDGSTDNTAAVIGRSGFQAIHLPVNAGVSNAILTGLRFALDNGYDCALLMDADGQHDPDDADHFIAALADHDFALGDRFSRPAPIPSCKIASNAFASALYRTVSGRHIPDVSCGYKAFHISRELLHDLESSAGYAIVYRLVNYAALHHCSVAFVPTDAIYYADQLLCTRVSELTALLDSAEELARGALAAENTTRMLTDLRRHMDARADFTVTLCGIPFHAFFLGDYDSYILQAPLEQIYHYYHKA